MINIQTIKILIMGRVVKMVNYLRQKRLFNPEEQSTEIIIVGAGSTGSFVSLNLAKMGMNKIKVIDFDIVEDHNIPNQFFRIIINKPVNFIF